MTGRRRVRAALACLGFLLLGLVIYGAADAESPVPHERCARRLAALVNPKLMSRVTALRKSRVQCERIEEEDRYFFKGITQ